ncbi:hypothetical protein QR680_007766 [Steinernema hermaphroditum]|uniref:Receptor L-domain domain-containing protein n=1 Tax=Steinernema hermaphroditum TaxID=289476 RepID=A0AA39IGL5_9BILA|nr:hypothetical protein QR680_007766 [Steinernema hermaphroditum]
MKLHARLLVLGAVLLCAGGVHSVETNTCDQALPRFVYVANMCGQTTVGNLANLTRDVEQRLAKNSSECPEKYENDRYFYMQPNLRVFELKRIAGTTRLQYRLFTVNVQSKAVNIKTPYKELDVDLEFGDLKDAYFNNGFVSTLKGNLNVKTRQFIKKPRKNKFEKGLIYDSAFQAFHNRTVRENHIEAAFGDLVLIRDIKTEALHMQDEHYACSVGALHIEKEHRVGTVQFMDRYTATWNDNPQQAPCERVSLDTAQAVLVSAIAGSVVVYLFYALTIIHRVKVSFPRTMHEKELLAVAEAEEKWRRVVTAASNEEIKYPSVSKAVSGVSRMSNVSNVTDVGVSRVGTVSQQVSLASPGNVSATTSDAISPASVESVSKDTKLGTTAEQDGNTTGISKTRSRNKKKAPTMKAADTLEDF